MAETDHFKQMETSHYAKRVDAPKVALRVSSAKTLLNSITKNFGTLPFCRRYLDRLGNDKYLLGLNNLVQSGIVEAYPPLCDVKGSYTAQFEHVSIFACPCAVRSVDCPYRPSCFALPSRRSLAAVMITKESRITKKASIMDWYLRGICRSNLFTNRIPRCMDSHAMEKVNKKYQIQRYVSSYLMSSNTFFYRMLDLQFGSSIFSSQRLPDGALERINLNLLEKMIVSARVSARDNPKHSEPASRAPPVKRAKSVSNESPVLSPLQLLVFIYRKSHPFLCL